MNAKSAWFVRWRLLYVIGGKEKECFVIYWVFDYDKVGMDWDVGIGDRIAHRPHLLEHKMSVCATFLKIPYSFRKRKCCFYQV